MFKIILTTPFKKIGNWLFLGIEVVGIDIIPQFKSFVRGKA
jgi:hypothetical protein